MTYLALFYTSSTMGAELLCSWWTCRPVWPLVILLAIVTPMLHCSRSPATAAGRMHPRGHHWAVGHLMGKKSIENLPGLQKTNTDGDGDFLPVLEPAAVPKVARYWPLMDVLRQSKKQKESTGRLLSLPSSWREEDRDKYLREGEMVG